MQKAAPVARAAGVGYGFGMDEDRVKDPLGHYEALREKTGPDTTWTGLKLLLIVPLAIIGIGLGLWGIVSAARSLFGG